MGDDNGKCECRKGNDCQTKMTNDLCDDSNIATVTNFSIANAPPIPKMNHIYHPHNKQTRLNNLNPIPAPTTPERFRPPTTLCTPESWTIYSSLSTG